MTDAAVLDPPPARRRGLSIWTRGLTILTVIGAGAMLWLRPHGDGGGGYYGQWIGKPAPDFALTGEDGNPRRLSSLRGRLVLMTFGFTHCPNICPTTLANLGAIYNDLSVRQRERVQVLFVSVDPSRDTPDKLKEYLAFYSPSFMGMTGKVEDITAVAKSYGAFFEAVMQDSQVANNYYTVNHSAYIYLIDPQGRFALLYDKDKLADHTRMETDIIRVLGAAGQ